MQTRHHRRDDPDITDRPFFILGLDFSIKIGMIRAVHRTKTGEKYENGQ